ncbi:MAG TPA: signal peptidase I [Opitutaceae bacterium]|nr:signal peptidase I [Opitutaceae bacterium]
MKCLLPPTARRLWREWLRPLALAAAVVLPLKSSLVEWNYIPSASMVPSLLPGDLVWVNKLAYDLKVPFTTWHLAQWGAPQRGEVAVFYSPADGTRLVKRVIGLPGDVIESRQDHLYVNGAPVAYTASSAGREIAGAGVIVAEEDLPGRKHPVMIQLQRPALRTFGPVRVPPGCYFMMGDNRDDSHDSRYFGCVPRQRIIGRTATVLASADPAHGLRPRGDRLLRAIP